MSQPRNARASSTAQKRALPPRNSFLTEAVQAALDRQEDDLDTIPFNADTVLVMQDSVDLASCNDAGPPPDLPSPHTETEPHRGFKVYTRTVRLKGRSKQDQDDTIEAPDEESYLRRHRKYEKEEKKVKNREKEKLQHEMYQQQQFVERVRQTDKNIIMSIATSLLQQRGQDPPPHIDADALRRRILRDAEDQLNRFEQLGFSLNSRKKTTADEDHHHHHILTPPPPSAIAPTTATPTAASPSSPSISLSPSKAPPPPSTATAKHPKPTPSSTSPLPSSLSASPVPAAPLPPQPQPEPLRQNGQEQGDAKVLHEQVPLEHAPQLKVEESRGVDETSQPLVGATPAVEVPPREPFRSFYDRPNAVHIKNATGGRRRSHRHLVAFGCKVPPIPECEFHLPYDPFGPWMDDRVRQHHHKRRKPS
ncbi:hypothetical protein BCR43DRAFT_315177 [Syncephalastrum racemosum]|uniref:Something about silencing protein 4 domain-containing protein n=1 Tax=Syncephalastrum racemosum TaxID=13706 RepID=A0A1X2HB43_SYNRA|nr:hypothetical protein BCR43DRAFT_315177 [Syncephalastrum racemosum]